MIGDESDTFGVGLTVGVAADIGVGAGTGVLVEIGVGTSVDVEGGIGVSVGIGSGVGVYVGLGMGVEVGDGDDVGVSCGPTVDVGVAGADVHAATRTTAAETTIACWGSGRLRINWNITMRESMRTIDYEARTHPTILTQTSVGQ